MAVALSEAIDLKVTKIKARAYCFHGRGGLFAL